MSIFSPQAPESAREALAADIGAFMEEAPASAWVAMELPIFVIDQKTAFDVGNLDEYGQPNAWRFVLKSKDEPIATGDVTLQTVAYELSAVSEDTERATELVSAVEFAEASADAGGDFELRLFEAPAFHLRAVWLHGLSRRDHDFFLLLDRHARRPADLMTADQFAGVFNRAMESKLGPRGSVDYSEAEIA